MRALFTLNRFFFKYRYKLALGFFFIILTNILAVYSPTLIQEGIAVLDQANKRYFKPIQEAEAGGAQVATDLFRGDDLTLPASLKLIYAVFGLDGSSSQAIASSDQLTRALIEIAIALAVLYILVYLLKGVFLFMTRQTIIVVSRLIEFDQKN